MSTSADFFGGNAKSASFDGQPGIKPGSGSSIASAQGPGREYVRPGGLIGAPQFYPSGDPVRCSCRSRC
jgi:hypothetical protein